MLKEQTSRPALLAGVVLLAAGLLAAARWDLVIDRALYAPTWLPAVLMEAFGWFPHYLPAVMLLACVALDRTRVAPLRAASGVLAAAGCVLLLSIGADHLLGRGMPAAPAAVWTALLGGLFLGACALALAKTRGTARARLQFLCLWGTIYLLAGLAAVNLLKAIWQRTRFDDMLASGSFALFTSWMQPLGNGGSSFPSGHTAAACSIFLLTLACDVFPGWARRRTLLWALGWGYVACMALCRIIIGRHFFSDTLAAAAVMTALLIAMRKTRAYRAGARRLAQPQ